MDVNGENVRVREEHLKIDLQRKIEEKDDEER